MAMAKAKAIKAKVKAKAKAMGIAGKVQFRPTRPRVVVLI